MKKGVGYLDVVIPALVYICVIFTAINAFSIITTYSAYSNVADIILNKCSVDGKVDYVIANKYVTDSGLEISSFEFSDATGNSIADGQSVQYGQPLTITLKGNIYPKYISKPNTLNTVNFVKSKNSLIYTKD